MVEIIDSSSATSSVSESFIIFSMSPSLLLSLGQAMQKHHH